MDKIRCFNCEKSLFRDNKGHVHHHRICTFRNIVVSGDQLFKKRSCRYFDLRHERAVKVREVTVAQREKISV